MKNRNRTTMTMMVATGVAVTLAASSCGMFKKKSTGSSSSSDPKQGAAISLSGTLNILEASTTSMNLLSNSHPMNLTAATYSLYCTSISSSSSDVKAVTSPIGSDGSFKVSLAAAKTALGCAVLDSASNQVAGFSFKDPTQKDFSGNPKVTERASLKGSVALGTVTADLGLGQVSIDTSAFAGKLSSSAPSNPFLFDGSWVINTTTPMPDGYTAPCSLAEQQAANAEGGHSAACNGPGAGEKIWIKTLKGTDTTSHATKYGIVVWQSEDAFKTCGSTLGFTYADAKTNAGIDLTGSGVAEGAFTWTSGWDDGWKSTAATATYSDNNCMPFVYTSASGATFDTNKCMAANGAYMISLGGGCFTVADGKPVQVTNWSTLTGGTPTTDNATGLPKSVMTGTIDGHAVQCTSIGGTFNENGTTLNGPFTPVPLLTQGQACSVAGTSDAAHTMAGMRCYSSYYWQHAGNGADASSTCLRKVQMDWTATDPAKFVDTNGPSQAQGQDVLALLNYVDNNTATFTNDQIDYQGVQSNNMWINCKMRRSFTMTLRRVSDTKATGEFIMTMKLVDTGKAACVADSSLQSMTIKNFMEFDKQ